MNFEELFSHFHSHASRSGVLHDPAGLQRLLEATPLPRLTNDAFEDMVTRITSSIPIESLTKFTVRENADPLQKYRERLLSSLKINFQKAARGMSFFEPGHLATSLSNTINSSPKFYILVRFGSRNHNCTGSTVQLANGWIDLNGVAPTTHFQTPPMWHPEVHSIHMDGYGVFKEFDFFSFRLQDINDVIGDLRALKAAFGMGLMQPLSVRDVVIFSNCDPFLPLDQISFAFNLSYQGDKYTNFFRSSAWIYNNQYVSLTDHVLVREWYSYLRGLEARLYRHEMVLDGYERILRSQMTDSISQREELTVGIIAVLAGLEGVLTEDAGDRPTLLFCEMGKYLYQKAHALNAHRVPRQPIADQQLKKFFTVLYRIRSKIAHAKADLIPGPSRGSASNKDLLKVLRVGNAYFSGRTLAFAFGLSMAHIFHVLEARRRTPDPDYSREIRRRLKVGLGASFWSVLERLRSVFPLF